MIFLWLWAHKERLYHINAKTLGFVYGITEGNISKILCKAREKTEKLSSCFRRTEQKSLLSHYICQESFNCSILFRWYAQLSEKGFVKRCFFAFHKKSCEAYIPNIRNCEDLFNYSWFTPTWIIDLFKRCPQHFHAGIQRKSDSRLICIQGNIAYQLPIWQFKYAMAGFMLEIYKSSNVFITEPYVACFKSSLWAQIWILRASNASHARWMTINMSLSQSLRFDAEQNK
jgi:hypothetical protein